MSGLSYLKRLEIWKREGYLIQIVFLSLKSPELAIKRVAMESGKADMMCQRRMSVGVSSVDWLISDRLTLVWLITGNYSKIREILRGYWRHRHEEKHEFFKGRKACQIDECVRCFRFVCAEASLPAGT